MMVGWFYIYVDEEYAYNIFLAGTYGAVQWILEMVVCTNRYRKDCENGINKLETRFPRCGRLLKIAFCCLWDVKPTTHLTEYNPVPPNNNVEHNL